MTNLLLQLLELTVSMSLLIAFILLFFKLFGKKFTAKCKYIVWTIVILRLCLPVGILSITPIFEIKVPSVQSTGVNTPNSGAKGDTTPDVPQAGAAATSPDINVQSPTVTPNVIPDISPNPTPTQSAPDTPALPSDIVTKNDSNNASENIHHGAQASENEVQKNAFSLSADMIPILICTVWLVGVLIFIGARLIPYAIYVLRMNKDGLLHTPSEEVETIYKALCLKLGVKRPPKLLVSRVPVSPHLCGFIRRKIIIPDMTYAMNDIESILSHELTHFKRGDLYVKLACTAAQAVSWFNPLVHLASGKCISEMELSCDESVLKNSNEEERILYGNAMLDIVRRCGLVKGSYLTSDFRPKRGAVKERIMNIINSEKKKKGLGIIAAALALCITAGTVIGCTVSAKESEKKENDTKVTETEAPVTDAPETDIPTWKQESLERRQEMHDFAEAFVKRDISKCAEIHRKYYYHSEDQSAAEERFAPLATLEFSKYDIEDVNGDSEYNDSIKMTFTISSSGYDAFPVGDYEGSLSIGPEGIYWKLQKPDDIALTEEEQASVDFITPFFPYMSTDDEESAHRGMTLGIFRELEKISDDPSLEVRATLDEIQEAAFELYSIDGFEPHESESRLLDDGYYTLPGKCGDVSFQRIKNITKADDFYFIDVQYFDEPIYFTPANTVRYAVAETDTRFGYRLQAAEVIDGFKEEASPIFLPYQLQAYEGVWRIDNREDTTLTINKVNTETGFASLSFSFVLSRSFSINTTAGLISGYYYFNDTENSGIQGRIRFYEKEIILIFDSFGSLPGYVGGWGSVYRFNTPENNWVIQNRVIPDVIPEFVQGDMKVYSPEDAIKYIPYSFTFSPTYRDIYYRQPSFLLDLVDKEDALNWYNEVVAPDIESNSEPMEMYTVSFIKRFHITKEEFEQANEQRKLLFEKFRDVNGDDISDEGHEIHNADIIYTFNNNIINNYYRRDICTYADVPNTTVDQNVTSVQNTATDQNIAPDAEIDEWIEQNKVDHAAVSKFVQGNMKVFSPEDAASKLPIKFDFSPKYRYTYYDWGLAVFSDFDVDNDEMNKWLDEAVTPTSKGTGQSEAEPPEMYMVSFIKYFHISKEEFERVCADRRAFMEQIPSYDVNGEAYELPNPDIIYTFDNDIINEYYLRETCTYVD